MNAPAAPANDWMPRRILSIGVTGHRLERLGAANIGHLHDDVAQVFASLSDAAALGGDTHMCVVSGLAEGADSIVADEALRRHWQLDVVLPFARDIYAADFPEGAARDAHVARLAAAHAVFELDGTRRGDEGDGVAYEQAGRVVLAQCDVLIAIWDSGPVRGRGGAAQIVAEAVLQGIPVIHIDPARAHPPHLLWDGLEEVDLGQQTVETVARGGLDGLPALMRALLDPPESAGERAMLTRFRTGTIARWNAALAYPLLLAVMGVRRPRWSDIRVADDRNARDPLSGICGSAGDFATGLRATLGPRFARGDAAATRAAQLFRSSYVSNFVLAAGAVLLSLLGLALPYAAKPVLIVLELLAIGTILMLTRVGNRAGWHRRWLDNRALAERLRCLIVSAQLGDLHLRGGGEGWVGWYARATARELGLPSACVDAAYLDCVRRDLTALIDEQIAYLAQEHKRMHALEHRLHTLGTILFTLTALTCVGVLVFKVFYPMFPVMEAMSGPVGLAATIISAALPAIGAAIYGIRMQGDFAGVAERGEALSHHLTALRQVIADDAPSFDTLSRRARRAADLLTDDLGRWFQTYTARPLSLPG